MMKNRIARPLALILCGALLVGGAGAAAYAANTSSKEGPAEEKNSLFVSDKPNDLQKDETVYVLAGADGSVQKIIVSDWIQNTLGRSSVSDKSELQNVENVKGEETYTMNGDNMRVWDAQGNDIYYQGNIQKELPVGLSLSYQLDGKSISPAELAGKSGKLSIRFDYQNNQYKTVFIDGEPVTIYVPFAMLTGMLLDNDVFANVKVTNGKLINDGSHTAVAGIAFPGLQSNLNISGESAGIPDYIQIDADVTKFELSNTVTIATNELFSQLNTEKLESVQQLTSSLAELTGAMDQLLDGSSQLYGGLCTLLNKSGELVQGIDQLAQGAAKLKGGAGELSNGAAELAQGAKTLANGLEQLSSNNSTLNAGSKQVFDSLLNMADAQLAAAGLSVDKLTIQNYADVLNGVVASLEKDKVAEQAKAEALEQVTKGVQEQKTAIAAAVAGAVEEEVVSKVTQSVRVTVEEGVLSAMGMTREDYETGVASGAVSKEQQAQITAAVAAQMNKDDTKAAVTAQVKAQMQSDEVQSLISTKTEQQMAVLIEQTMNSDQVQGQITEALKKAESGAASLSALKQQLDSYSAFYAGVNQYTAGVISAGKGAQALKSGASSLQVGTAGLSDGVNRLYDGILTLKSGTPALVNGVTELRDGSMTLSDGLKEFNQKGVQRIVAAVKGDLGGLAARLKATVDVSRDYRTFSGLSDNMEGQVKFIYRTEAISIS